MTNHPIKFRVWDSAASKYLENEVMWSVAGMPQEMMPGQHPFIPFLMVALLAPADKYVVQQFTNLFDKNGKEIYEGDILKCKGYDGWFDREGFYYNMEVKFSIHPAGDTQLAGFNYIPKDSEVIGNKFENGELLKK